MIRGFEGKTPKIAPTAFISEAAYVVGDVEIGDYSSVWPGAVIRADYAKIVIGRCTNLEDNCVVHCGTPLIIGNDVIVGHGAVIHCGRIGDNVLVGSNATLLDEAEIDDFCIIGAGSLVTQGMRIPQRSLVLGVPATIRGQLSNEQVSQLKEAGRLYAEFAQRLKREGLCDGSLSFPTGGT